MGKDIDVLLRIRPDVGEARNEECCVRAEADGSVSLKPMRRWAPRHRFSFDSVLDGALSDKTLEQCLAAPLVSAFTEGRGACALIHGHTGSGKTHLMSHDLIPAIARTLPWASSSPLSMRCVEIYQEKLFDLLRADETCPPPLRVVGGRVPGMTSVEVGSAKDLMAEFEAAVALRVARRTAANPSSSRSHFLVMLQAGDEEGGSITVADLAGCESLTGMHGERLKREAKKIRLSLLSLRNVIKSLGDQMNHAWAPFRDSLLTRLLRPVLEDPTSKLMLIATVNPREQHHEALLTLNFATGMKRFRAATQLITEPREKNDEPENRNESEMGLADLAGLTPCAMVRGEEEGGEPQRLDFGTQTSPLRCRRPLAPLTPGQSEANIVNTPTPKKGAKGRPGSAGKREQGPQRSCSVSSPRNIGLQAPTTSSIALVHHQWSAEAGLGMLVSALCCCNVGSGRSENTDVHPTVHLPLSAVKVFAAPTPAKAKRHWGSDGIAGTIKFL